MGKLLKPLSASLFPEPDVFDSDAPKKRKKPVMLTARSRKFLEREGWLSALVERTVDVPKFQNGRPTGERFRNKFDCFGFADLVAVKPGHPGTLYIQVTDHSHHAERREKIIAASAAPVIIASGNGIVVHSWDSKKPRGRPKLWRLRVQQAELIERGTKVAFQDSEIKWFKDDGSEYYDPTF